MAIKINFDSANIPETPTIILGNRNGEKLGQISAKNIVVKDSLKEAAEISFCVYKYENDIKANIWDKIVNSRVVWCKEWDMWFDISVEINESDKTIKNVSCVQLGPSELSQTNLYNVEINTENDIKRDDYEITVLFDENNPNASLLNRLLEKAPHYSIEHVDSSIANIQRTFTFDNVSIYDAFQDISEEINCIFIFNSNSDNNGNIVRSISVYDLDTYGSDTTIFVTADELANEIQLTTDMDNVKNCFKLEAGDDLMTAAVRSCNPNGSDYIWHIPSSTKSLMSNELSEKIDEYENVMEYYQNIYTVPSTQSQLLGRYNNLIFNYHSKHNYPLNQTPSVIIGYQKLMECYYNAVDFEIYLQSILMPNIDLDLQDTNAQKQSALLSSSSLSPASVTNINTLSTQTADSVILSVAKIIIDSRYKVKIINSSLSQLDSSTNSKKWKGIFIVTNYSNEEDTATTEEIEVTINNNYETFVKQKVKKVLHDKDTIDYSISGLFNMNINDFCAELKNYCMDSLKMFYEICQTVIDILIEQGVLDTSGWTDTENGSSANLYEVLYVPYYNKLNAIQSEIVIRQKEIDLISGIYDGDKNLVSHGVKTFFSECIKNIQNSLNFESFLGKSLLMELCSYRREEKYSNSNYISDGLNNAELIKKSMEFLASAKKEIYKTAELQHSISAPLKNFLVINKFNPLVKYFATGNWVRIRIDNTIYKLRLTQYEINYNELENISVEFSDMTKPINVLSSLDFLKNTQRIVQTYNSVKYKAENGDKGNRTLNGLLKNGFNTNDIKIISDKETSSQKWDSHGLSFRSYDTISKTYSPHQLKLIDSSIILSNDNWQSSKMGIGLFNCFDKQTGEYKQVSGINAELIIGKLILGEYLKIQNKNNTLKFDDNGFYVGNTKISFIVNPNNKNIVYISSNQNGKEIPLFYVNNEGELYIRGNGNDLDISENESMIKKIDVEIENHPESIQTAWNKISDCISIETNDIADVFHFYNSDQNLGNLGVIKSDNPEINFNLNPDTKFSFTSKDEHSNEKELLSIKTDNVSFDVDIHGNGNAIDGVNLRNVQFEGKQGATNTFQIVSKIEKDSNNNITPIYTTITVQNGIIMDIS